jgi:hypothetical protein
MGRDVTEQVQGMAGEAGLPRRGCDHAVAQVPCLVEPAEQQTGATESSVRTRDGAFARA